MPLRHYGVLKGSVVDARREDDPDTHHYQVHVRANSTSYRVAVNVKSRMSPSELLFIVDDSFRHPVTAGLPELPMASRSCSAGPVVWRSTLSEAISSTGSDCGRCRTTCPARTMT
jgi:uncharacterized protein YukJ